MNPQVIEQLSAQITELDSKISTAKELLVDPEMGPLAQEEIEHLTAQKSAIEGSLVALQQTSGPIDTQQDLNVNKINLEIRAGAGGEEAKLWAENLLRMYARYCETKKITIEAVDPGNYQISGKNVYNLFKFESGVHRVQRVPETESQGRVHTSTASVAILPTVKPQAVEIRDEDLEWQFVRSGGAGGQNVNKVNTAVRLTHTPSGLVISCSKERTQIRNREIALEMLRSQIWEIEEEKRLGGIENQRKAAVGRAMRAEKIRTYNYPQNRVTDHRINTSWHNLDSLLEGDIEKMLKEVSEKMQAL